MWPTSPNTQQMFVVPFNTLNLAWEPTGGWDFLFSVLCQRYTIHFPDLPEQETDFGLSVQRVRQMDWGHH